MNYAVVGYGRMGRAIEGIAKGRGHRRIAVVDRSARARGTRRTLDVAALRGVEVAFEFTRPDAAREHVAALLDAGIAVVCGTTGWSVDRGLRRLAEERGVGAVIAPNFSIGMFLFDACVRRAARDIGRIGIHDPFVREMHHRGKIDAPGGTAKRLAETVASSDPRRPVPLYGEPDGRLPDGALHVAAVRAGFEPGTHVVGFDGPHDVIELTHRARSREGFAAGAVAAAEWLAGGVTGIHGFGAVMRDRASGARAGGP